MTLGDRIILDGVNTTLTEVVDTGLARELPRRLCRCPAFDISDVANYLFAVTEQEEWVVGKDFACLAPPYPEFWMEYHRPSMLRSEETGTHDTRLWPERTGFYVLSELAEEVHARLLDPLGFTDYVQGLEVRIRSAARTNQLQSINAKLRAARDDMEFRLSLTEAERLTHNVIEELERIRQNGLEEGKRIYDAKQALGGHWYLKLYLFQLVGPLYGPHIRRDTPNGPLALYEVLVAKDGSPIEARYSTTPSGVSISEELRQAGSPTGWYSCFFPAFLALDWLHLHGTELTAREQPPKLLKAYQKKHGQPMLKFYTLEIDALRKVLKEYGAERRGEGQGLKMALHRCRLHYRTYGPEYGHKKLFGKLEGSYRVLVPAHMRGTKREGEVIKNYRVAAGKEPKEGE